MSHFIEILFWFSIGGIAYSYCGYPVALWVLARVFGKPVAKDELFRPTVAIVIPAYNEDKVIKEKINNTLALEYPKELLSIWVGSDQSTDATDEIVQNFHNPHVHLWRAPFRGGKTSTINTLVPQINADIIVITDADIVLEPDSLIKLVRNYADLHVGGVCGSLEQVALQKKDGQEEKVYRSFESFLKEQETALHSSISVFGAFYSFRKTAFCPLPKNAYSNDDVMIGMTIARKGLRVIFDPQSHSFEQINQEIKIEFKRRVRIGAGNFQAFFWLLDFLNPRKGWLSFCYVSHKVMRWFSPFFIILCAVSSTILVTMSLSFLHILVFVGGFGIIAATLLYMVFPIRLLKPVFYFMSMNVALLFGFFRFVSGIKNATWSSTERSGSGISQ